MAVVLFILSLSCNKQNTESLIKSTNKETERKFALAVEKCESIMKNYISENKLNENFILNRKTSSLKCGDSIIKSTDSVNCQPNIFKIKYDFIIDNEIQEDIEFEFNSLVEITEFNKNKLKGLIKFTNGNLKIFKKSALETAKRYEIIGKNVSAVFKTYQYPKNSPKYIKNNSTLYYWEIGSNCNNCKTILMDAKTGKVFQVLTTKHIY